MSSEAFVTLATTDGYGLGALVLAESIRQVGTKRSLVVLISNHLSDLIKQTLEISFDEVIVVDELNSNDIEHLNLLSRPELGITFTKINCWLLEQYSKCVFLDADCVVLRSIDDLFEREQFSAAPDAGWPDCFNSGVFVYRPSKETFTKLMLFASQQNSSFDGGDQGLLNAFYSNWRTGDISRHLPFTYNVTANAFYSYLPAVTRFRNDIHVVHFAGALKPWQLSYNPQNQQLSGNLSGQNDIQREFLLSWWTIMHQRVWPNITKLNQQANSNNKWIGGEDQFGGSINGSLNYGNLTNNPGIEVGSAAHRRAWESGQIDYYGRDSFSNIQQQLERNIAQQTQPYHPSQQKQISPDKTTTTGILKSFNKEPTPPLLQSTNNIKSSLKETTPQQTTNGSQNILKEQSTNGLKSVLKETIPSSQQPKQNVSQPSQQTKTNVSQQSQQPKLNVSQQLQETKTNVSQQSQQQPKVNVSQQLQQPKTNVPQQSQQPKVNVPQQSQQIKTNVSQQSQSTNIVKSSSKETTTPLQHQNIQSTNLNENKHSIPEHQSNWTVKSTIVTAYTPGSGDHSGPTVISKAVSESTATASNDIPIKTSVKQMTDSSNSSGLNLKGNGTTVRGVASSSSNNGNRVNK